MKQILKSADGYRVYHLNAESDRYVVFDGDRALYAARLRTLEDYVSEFELDGNEWSKLLEMFTTVDGIIYAHWCDCSTREHFLTEVMR